VASRLMDLDAGVILAVVTGLSALAVALANRRKAEGEATAAITQTVLALLKPLQERVAALEAEVQRQKTVISTLREGIKLLCNQITELGHDPVWQLDDDGQK